MASPGSGHQHKELVSKLREKLTLEPQKRHFIKEGKICSVDYTVSDRTGQ